MRFFLVIIYALCIYLEIKTDWRRRCKLHLIRKFLLINVFYWEMFANSNISWADKFCSNQTKSILKKEIFYEHSVVVRRTQKASVPQLTISKALNPVPDDQYVDACTSFPPLDNLALIYLIKHPPRDWVNVSPNNI